MRPVLFTVFAVTVLAASATSATQRLDAPHLDDTVTTRSCGYDGRAGWSSRVGVWRPQRQFDSSCGYDERTGSPSAVSVAVVGGRCSLRQTSERQFSSRDGYDGNRRLLGLVGGREAGFTGHRTESALGLVSAEQRWLDPLTGTWMSRDPVGAASYLQSPNELNPWLYAASNPTRYTDPDGRCLPGMGLAECVTFDSALVGSYAKRRQELGLKMGADIFLGPVRAAEELAKCATEPTLSNCKAFRFTIGMDPSEKEELAKLFAQSAGWEDFKTGLSDRDPVLMGRGFASMQYEFEQFANMVAGTAGGALGELPSVPPVQVRAPVPNAPPVNKGLLLQRRIRLTAGGVNSPSKEAAKRAADIRLPRGSHLQKDSRADQARAAASEPTVAPSSAGSPAAYRRYEDLEHLKLTDRMSPQRMDAHVENVAQRGFENPVINYVVIDGENYVVWGNNRVTAARRLGRTGELLFEEVKLPFRGFRDAEDVLAAHIEYLTGQ